MPNAVVARVGQAQQALADAQTKPARRARKLAARAVRLLEAAERRLSKASRRRRDPLPPTCATDVSSLLLDIRSRAQAYLDELRT
jgi:hypothetical protein